MTYQAASQDRRNGALNLPRAHERVRSAGTEANATAMKGARLSAPNFERFPRKKHNGQNHGNKKLLEQLEAENAELRDKAADLALQIQALRDGVRVQSA